MIQFLLDRAMEHDSPAARSCVPPALLLVAGHAFASRDIGSDLAELVFDSLLDEDDLSLVRGSAGRRLVSFRAREVSVDVEVTGAGSARAVHGQIMPLQPAVVDIRRVQGSVTAAIDELGRFQAGPLPSSPMSLRVSMADSLRYRVTTDWVSI